MNPEVEKFAEELIEKYETIINSMDGLYWAKEVVNTCAIQDCQSTIEELKLYGNLKEFVDKRIHFYTQVIECLNK